MKRSLLVCNRNQNRRRQRIIRSGNGVLPITTTISLAPAGFGSLNGHARCEEVDPKILSRRPSANAVTGKWIPGGVSRQRAARKAHTTPMDLPQDGYSSGPTLRPFCDQPDNRVHAPNCKGLAECLSQRYGRKERRASFLATPPVNLSSLNTEPICFRLQRHEL